LVDEWSGAGSGLLEALGVEAVRAEERTQACGGQTGAETQTDSSSHDFAILLGERIET
jgi:heterodisulfide reductase subunit B